MFCASCGKEIGNNVKFCPYCGSMTKAIPAPSSKIEKVNLEELSPQIQKQSIESNLIGASVQPEKHNSARIVVILLIVLAVTLFGFLFSHIKPNEHEENSTSNGNVVLGEDSMGANFFESIVGEGTPVSFEDAQMEICVKSIMEIPSDEDMTDKQCEQITSIDTSGYVLSTLSDLEKFPNLKVLYVDNSDIELSLKGINKAPNLISITLKNCKLSEVDRLSEITNLEYLDISTSSSWGTQVNDYSTLEALKNLKHLDMSWNGYNAYNEFDLVDASFINSLTNLEELNIYETGIENYSFANLRNLKKLTISRCNVDAVLQQLCENGSINNLEELTVYCNGSYRNQISNDGIKDYLSKANNLKVLTLSGTGNLTSLSGLGNLTNLETFYFDNGNAYDLPVAAYDELSKLTKLTDLTITCNANVYEVLHDTQTPNDYSFLNRIPSLIKLKIDTYDGMKISCFNGLNNLEELTLGSYKYSPNEVDISGIEEFRALKIFRYCTDGVRFKSSAPLDDLDDIQIEEFTAIAGY